MRRTYYRVGNITIFSKSLANELISANSGAQIAVCTEQSRGKKIDRTIHTGPISSQREIVSMTKGRPPKDFNNRPYSWRGRNQKTLRNHRQINIYRTM